MTFEKLKWGITAVVLGVFLAASGNAQQTHKAARACYWMD
jgi:hypothetical protein